MRRVLTLSYYNDPNFGDRLGYHLVNSIVPPDCLVVHASVKPWTVPDEPFDLLILGIGNSLNSATVRHDELLALIDRVPRTVGIFGIQYAHHFGKVVPVERFQSLLDRLSFWFARSRRDLDRFGRGRTNAIHLGDWLVTMFPMTQWTDPGTLVIPPGIKRIDAPLDRAIQKIQRYRRVDSARLHPLLCALTSAEAVAYHEQREDPYQQVSGKFAAMLLDVFGRELPPDVFFDVDRDAVARYKTQVSANVQHLAETVRSLLI